MVAILADEQIAYLEDLINNYPIDSIRGWHERASWEAGKLTSIGNRCQLVGGNLFVTSGIHEKYCHRLRQFHPYQSQSKSVHSVKRWMLSEMAHRHGYTTVTSHVPAKPRTPPLQTLPLPPTADKSQDQF